MSIRFGSESVMRGSGWVLFVRANVHAVSHNRIDSCEKFSMSSLFSSSARTVSHDWINNCEKL